MQIQMANGLSNKTKKKVFKNVYIYIDFFLQMYYIHANPEIKM